MKTYNKDQEYTLKVVNTDNEIKEIKYTPDKDMSKPEMIMALKSKYKNFFKLIENKRIKADDLKIGDIYIDLSHNLQKVIDRPLPEKDFGITKKQLTKMFMPNKQNIKGTKWELEKIRPATKEDFENYPLIESKLIENDSTDIISTLNTLKDEFLNNLYKDKDKANEVKEQVKKVLQDAPDGTALYRLYKDTSSGWTSHGSYYDERTIVHEYKKENGTWTMCGRKKDTIDDAVSSVLYNEGKFMTKEEAEAKRGVEKVNDRSSHRDIVNVGTDKWGNPVGKSINRVEYPNKKTEEYFVCSRCLKGVDLDYNVEDYVIDPKTGEEMCRDCAIKAGIPVDDLDESVEIENHRQKKLDELQFDIRYDFEEAYKDWGNEVSKTKSGFVNEYMSEFCNDFDEVNWRKYIVAIPEVDKIYEKYKDIEDWEIPEDVKTRLYELITDYVQEYLSKVYANKKTEAKNTDPVIVISYGRGMRFPDRKTAIEYYKECVEGTDLNGSENYSYQNILYELMHTDKDVVYDTDDETEYDWWVQKGKPTDDVSDELLKAHLGESKDINKSFSADIKSLYDKYGEKGMRWCRIEHTVDDNNEYYDLYYRKPWGYEFLACCDGEDVTVVDIQDAYVILRNIDNGSIFEVIPEEFEIISNNKLNEGMTMKKEDLSDKDIKELDEYTDNELKKMYDKYCSENNDKKSFEEWQKENVDSALVNELEYEFFSNRNKTEALMKEGEELLDLVEYWHSNGISKEISFLDWLKEQYPDKYKEVVNRIKNIKTESVEDNLDVDEETFVNGFVGQSLNTLLTYLDDGHDIADDTYDGCVVFFPSVNELDDTDNYDLYIQGLSHTLKVVEGFDENDVNIIVNITDYVIANKDVLLDLFEADGETDEEIMEDLICRIMPMVISGCTTDNAYKILLNTVNGGE